MLAYGGCSRIGAAPFVFKNLMSGAVSYRLAPITVRHGVLVRHGWTEPVRPERAFEKAQLDHQPDRADERDKTDEHPPTGFVAVVKAFDIDDYGWDHRD